MAERIAWIALALVHFLPGVAVAIPSMITRLYGVESESPIFPLLHHRAALFAIVLIICLWAVVDPNVRRVATVAAGFSMLSFLAIYWSAGQPVSLRPIALGDIIGLPFLAFAAWRAFVSA